MDYVKGQSNFLPTTLACATCVTLVGLAVRYQTTHTRGRKNVLDFTRVQKSVFDSFHVYLLKCHKSNNTLTVFQSNSHIFTILKSVTFYQRPMKCFLNFN